MEFSVLVEPTEPQGFRATALSFPEIFCEWATEEKAIRALQAQLCERLKLAKMVKVNVPMMLEKPWMAAAGCLQHEPELEAYQAAILENRRQADAWAEIAGAFQDAPDYAEVIEHMKACRAERNRELDLLPE
jgi:hypothetical protein